MRITCYTCGKRRELEEKVCLVTAPICRGYVQFIPKKDICPFCAGELILILGKAAEEFKPSS